VCSKCSSSNSYLNEDAERTCFACGLRFDPAPSREERAAEDEARNEAARLAGELEDRMLGGEMFPVVVADAFKNGHLTEREAEERLALHKLVTGRP
jgi:hypothetical protein